jgi:hypothetical protein
MGAYGGGVWRRRGATSWQPHLADLIDPRLPRSRRPELRDGLARALGAVGAGVASWPAGAAEGRANQEGRAQGFRLPHALPAPATFRRAFGLLDPEAVQPGFARWTAARAAAVDAGSRRALLGDGKTRRRRGRPARGQAAWPRVSAWAGANHITWGPGVVDRKAHAITAIPRLRERLERAGARGTSDARGGQKEIAAQSVAGGGDSIRALKDHQPNFPQDLPHGVPSPQATEFAGVAGRGAGTEETNRGRDERRDCQVRARPPGRREAGLGRGRAALGRVLGRRVGEGVARGELRSSRGSFLGTADEDLPAIRGPGSIANAFHGGAGWGGP